MVKSPFNTPPLAITAANNAGTTALLNVALPVVSGAPVDGEVLTVNTPPGTWTGSPTSYELSWERDGATIAGATETTYQTTGLDIDRHIRVRTTAYKDNTMPVTAVSLPVGPVARRTAPAAVPGTSATHGPVSFAYSGSPLVTGNSFDGSAFIVVPDAGSVEITAVTPAVTTIEHSAVTYTISGVAVNPVRDGSHPFDQRQPDNFDAGAMATFPQTLSPGDIIVKQISSADTTPATIRNGTAEAFGVCHIIDQSTYDALQLAGGIANHIAPAPFGWAGRSTFNWRFADVDALFAARPLLSLAEVEIPNDAGITIPDTVARLDRFNPGLISRVTTGVTGSYETASLRHYATAGNNYGEEMVQTFRRIQLAFIGDVARADIEPAIRRLLVLGSWFYDQEVGRGNTFYKPDGGHHLFMMVPTILGLLATDRAALVDTLATVSNQNQLKGWVEMTSDNLARLVPHNSTTEPFTYREWEIDSIVGNQINFTAIGPVQPYYRNFWGLECRRVSDDAFMGIVNRKIAADPANNFVTLDRTPTGLLDTDQVYFSTPEGWLTEGDYVWSVDGSMAWMTTSPRPTYANLNGWAAECLFVRAMGLYSSQFEPMEVLTKRRVYEEDARPSDMIGEDGTILGFTAFGEAYVSDLPVETDNSRFTKTFWNAHADDLGLGDVPVEPPALYDVWYDLRTHPQTLIPPGTSSATVDTPFMGAGGYFELTGNGAKVTAGTIRFGAFALPAVDLAETDLLVSTFETEDPVTSVVEQTRLGIGTYEYRVPDAGVVLNPVHGFDNPTGKILQASQVGHYRVTNWAGAPLQDAGSSGGLLALGQLNNGMHSRGVTKIGPIIRVYGDHPKPMVCLTFDDNGSAQYTNLFPTMQSLGLVGNIYAAYTTIGSAGKMTYDQAREMQAAGWCFALDSNSPMTAEETPAAKIAYLDAETALLLTESLGTADSYKHIRYSNASNDYPWNSLSGTISANGTTTLTRASGAFASGVANGAVIKGSQLDGGADVVVVKALSSTTFEVNRTVATGSYANARVCAIESGRNCTSDGSDVLAGIDTRGITAGMTVVGVNVPPGTTVLNILVDSATGSLTLSENVTGVTSASFYIAGAPWLPGKFMDAAYAAGYRSGLTIGADSGIYTGLGVVNPRNLLGIAAFAWENQASAITILRLQQLFRNKRDVFPNHHWTNAWSANPADVAIAEETLQFLADRRDAGEIDVVTLTEWYERAVARSPIT